VRRHGSSPAVALLAAAALAACRAEPQPRERLVIADVRQPATSLLLLALADGCTAREGLGVEEHTFDLGRDALALLREGHADVAVAYETPFLRAAAQDPRLRVLTKLHTSTRNTRVVARGDRGVASFSDLRGKRIGVAAGTNADFLVELALRYGGVPREAVTIVRLEPEDSAEALAAGALDAAVLSDPAAARAEEALGTNARTVQTELYAEVSLLITRADVVATRGPALRALVRALACAERGIRERPDEAFARVRDRFPEQGERALRAQLDRVARGLGLDNVLLQVLRDEGRWLRDAGLSQGSASPTLDLLERSVLADVDPEAVMLLPRRVP
jgi:ABC-type nitrate/sulfonate/bicarbonate transport system substrate-binding protein